MSTPSQLGFSPDLFDTDVPVLTECIEGPYYTEPPVRKDIRANDPSAMGARLDIGFLLMNAKTGVPEVGAKLDIWNCNAQGMYSGFEYVDPDEPPNNPGDMRPQSDARWLRGRQIAGPDGLVEFTGVYPSWYSTRVPHVHVKVWLGENCVLTSQFFFPNEMTETLLKVKDYARTASPDADMDSDFVRYMMGYDGGAMLHVEPSGDGYRAWATIAFDPDARSEFKPMTRDIWEDIPTDVGIWRSKVPGIAEHYADMKRRGK